MRVAVLILSLLVVLVPALAHAEDVARLELNALEKNNNRCVMTFVISNKTAQPFETFKLELALFNTEGVIIRNVGAEFGPLRSKGTVVRRFPTDGDCAQIGSLLVNDVTACTPLQPAACIEGLDLSSRVKDVRLYR